MSARARAGRRLFAATLAVAGLLSLTACAVAAMAGFFGGEGGRFYGAGRANVPVAAFYMSGDMGLRFGMGPHVAPALAQMGLPVLGLSSPNYFKHHRTRADVDAIVADGVRQVLGRTGARRVVIIGQSFGADMIATALPDLPADLRARVAAVILVVPGRDAYFRADPLGFAYRGTPDAQPAAGIRTVGWAPLVCIHGAAETDSLCPLVGGTAIRQITLPGGHFLRNDYGRLIAVIRSELGRVGVLPLA